MYSKNQLVTATVERVFSFGVFVKLEDGTRAYIRRRELTLPGDIDPREAVRGGEQIEAVVIELATADALVELSRRRALPDPWNDFRQHQRGDIVTATIKHLFPDQVTAQIIPGVSGHIPIEELATWKVERPEDVVWTGDQVEAVITHLDTANKRVRLSIRLRLEQLTQAEAVVEYLRGKANAAAEAGAVMELIWPEATEPGRIALAKPVLVVEDYEAVREPLIKWLLEQGCVAQGAETAAEALACCQSQQYGLILIDLGLPEVDGLSLIQKLREAGVVALMAVMSGPEMIAEQLPALQEWGVSAVFAKPLDLDEIRYLLLRLAQGEKIALPETRPSLAPAGAQSFQNLATVMRSGISLLERFGQGLEQLVQETRAEMGIVFHLEPVSHKVSLVARNGSVPLNMEAVYSLPDSPVKDVILEGMTMWESRVSAEKTGRFRKLRELLPFESCIGVPVQAVGQVEYALFLFHREAEVFSRYRVRDALTMAGLFAVALESHVLSERLYSLNRVLLSGHLAAGFGHEVYNSVSGLDLQFRNVRSDLERLARAAPGLSERPEFKESRQDLDKAIETVTRLAQMVQDFQKLMRTEEAQEVDVNQIVRQAEAQVRPLANKAKVKLHLNLAANLPMAVGGSIRLQQVFLNLTLNAVQQMEGKADGRRALVISTACREDECHWVQIRFSDTGPGIHQQILPKIFDLGFTTRTGGSGLGLYIARSLVESMGGQIVVEKSLVPIGTTFLVNLRAAGPVSSGSKPHD